MLIGLFLLLLHPPLIHGKELLSYVCLWIGFIVVLMVYPSLRMIIERDETVRKHKRGFVVSWIYLVAGAVVSLMYVILFPNWSVWTSFPMNPYSLINPYTFLVAVAVPVFILFYNRILLPEGREEISEWGTRRRRRAGTS